MLSNVLLRYFVLLVMMNSILTNDLDRSEFTDCGSTDVIIHKVNMMPMPIVYPGMINATLEATVKRPICKFLV